MVLAREEMILPAWEVYFNNTKLHPNLKKYITLIEFEESDSEADLARVTVSDLDFVFSNSLSLTKKMPFKLEMGFKNNLKVMLVGEVSHIEADFGEDGNPMLVIGAVDITNQMTTKKKTRKWKKVTSAQVVREICSFYGYTLVGDTSGLAIIDEIAQDDETDAQLVMRLADDEAFQCYIVPDTKKLYFGKRLGDVVATDTVYYKSGDYSVQYFRPNFVEKNKANNVSSTEGGISDETGDSYNNTTSASSKDGSSGSDGSSSNQSSTEYTIDTVTGDMERRR